MSLQFLEWSNSCWPYLKLTCNMWREKKENQGASQSLSSVKFFIPGLYHCAFISVWLAATRALWTPGSVKRMYISQPGLCEALPGNKAEVESHREKTQWTDPTHSSPLQYTSEAHRESDSSYVHVCAYVKVDFVCIINKTCVCFDSMWIGGLVCITSTCVCLCLCVGKLWSTWRRCEKVEVQMKDTCGRKREATVRGKVGRGL